MAEGRRSLSVRPISSAEHFAASMADTVNEWPLQSIRLEEEEACEKRCLWHNSRCP